MKIKTNEIPRHAKHLYIKLYCEKKGGQTEENIHNAAQSWLSLSITKKQHFYDTISTKLAVKKAQLIIQTEPFLKEKLPSNTRKRKRNSTENGQEDNEIPDSELATNSLDTSVNDETIMDDNHCHDSFIEENILSETLPMTITQVAEDQTLQDRAGTCGLDQTHNEPEICDNSYMSNGNEDTDTADEDVSSYIDAEKFPLIGRLSCDAKNKLNKQSNKKLQKKTKEKTNKSYMSIIDKDTDSENEDCAKEKNVEKGPLVEPILPVAKTGKDLFDLLKTKNGVNKEYESLTIREKKFYGHAVRAIKRDYVKKYKEYLESLSSRQLFDYYKKIFE